MSATMASVLQPCVLPMNMLIATSVRNAQPVLRMRPVMTDSGPIPFAMSLSVMPMRFETKTEPAKPLPVRATQTFSIWILAPAAMERLGQDCNLVCLRGLKLQMPVARVMAGRWHMKAPVQIRPTLKISQCLTASVITPVISVATDAVECRQGVLSRSMRAGAAQTRPSKTCSPAAVSGPRRAIVAHYNVMIFIRLSAPAHLGRMAI